ncbi:MAG: hypothetical protein Q7S70_00410 [bacterium]|nr:hypothetical protein [bacterium]
MIKKAYINIVILSISFSLFSNFSFAQIPGQTPPDNLNEAQEMGERALEISKEKLPGTLEKIWQKEVLPVWEKMYGWFDKKIGFKIKNLFLGEMEKRGPDIKKEFQKEKQEAKEEAPSLAKSLWQKFKDLIR